MPDTNRAFWLKRARHEALRFNFGWWLHFFLRGIFGLGVLGSAGILGLRTANYGLLGLSIVLVALTLAAMVVSLFLAREKFLSVSEALARLDADLGLYARLSSAIQGVGEWPASRPNASLALRWNWKPLLKRPVVAGVLMAASIWVPLPKGPSKPTSPTANPPSWDAIQTRLDTLKDSEIFQTEALEGLQRSLDALRSQPPKHWYGHESLEASSQLQEQLDQSAGRLGEQLETALSIMEAARSIESHQWQALAKPLDRALGEAIKAMELGALPLNQQTASDLRGLDGSRIRQLTSEEWKSLSDKLKAGITAGATGYPQSHKAGDRMLTSILGQGSGDVARGPGPAPLMLGAEKTQLGTTQTEAVQNDDVSRAAVGDLAGLSASEPEADKMTWTPGQSGGVNSSTGTGGAAVWEQVATPAEQEALRRFFK